MSHLIKEEPLVRDTSRLTETIVTVYTFATEMLKFVKSWFEKRVLPPGYGLRSQRPHP